MGHISLCSSMLLGHDRGDRAAVRIGEMGVAMTSDGPDEARELEKFLWVRVCALGE